MSNALVCWTLAYVAGVVVGDLLGCGESAARALALIALALLALSLFLDTSWRNRRGRGASSEAAPLLLRLGSVPALLFAAWTLGMWAQARRPPLLDEASLARDETWRCEGQVASAVDSTVGGVTFRLAVDEIGPYPQDLTRPGLGSRVGPALIVSVTVAGRLLEPLWPGDRVRIAAALRSSQGYLNPGGADRMHRLASLGANAVAFVPAGAVLRLDQPFSAPKTWSPAAFSRWLELSVLRAAAVARTRLLTEVRAQLLGKASERDGAAAELYGLIAALALGERGPLLEADALRVAHGRPAIEANFRAAGIFHILSVSGLHLAVAGWGLYRGLAWLLLFLAGLAQRWVARRIAAVAALPAILFYTLLTGAELPTVRAAVATILWLLAVACGRRARLLEALAAAVLYIARPAAESTPALCLYEPSFLLSIAATLAIAYLQPLAWLVQRSPAALRLPLRLIDASLAATLATLPLCAYYFIEVQPAGVLGNLLAVPLGEFVVLPAGLLGAVAAVVLPPWMLGGPLLELAAAAGRGMLRATDILAQLSPSGSVAAPNIYQLLLWFLGLLICAGRRYRIGVGCCAAGLCLYMLGILLPPGQLQVTFLDVGQGDATVIELPHGGVVVLDAGPGAMSEGGRDLGELVVAPFLRRRGHRRIDLLIASHRHPDHIGGLVSLLERFTVGTLWLPPSAAAPPMQGPRSGKAAELASAWQRVSEAAVRHGVQVQAPRDFTIDEVAIEVLAPCREARSQSESRRCNLAVAPTWSENDSSLVMRLRYGSRVLLFPGDLELNGELALLERYDRGVPVAADILKAPHHCSRTSSSESFVKAVSPRWVICSVGHRNRFGFPHAEVLARYRDLGSMILRTDEDGAVRVAISAEGGLKVEHFPRPIAHTVHFPLALKAVQR